MHVVCRNTIRIFRFEPKTQKKKKTQLTRTRHFRIQRHKIVNNIFKRININV